MPLSWNNGEELSFTYGIWKAILSLAAVCTLPQESPLYVITSPNCLPALNPTAPSSLFHCFLCPCVFWLRLPSYHRDGSCQRPKILCVAFDNSLEIHVFRERERENPLGSSYGTGVISDSEEGRHNSYLHGANSLAKEETEYLTSWCLS